MLYRLATKHPGTAATCFALLETTANDLLNRGPAKLHAVEHGMARDVGPAKLHDAPTNQKGTLKLLEPWFVGAVEKAAANTEHGLDSDTAHEAMLAVMCVFGHAVTACLMKLHPKLGAKLGMLLWADAKTVDRMRIKWEREHGRDFGALLDFIRFSLNSPDQAAQEKFIALVQKSKFAIRRIKSTHSDPAAQVKQCLVNLELKPGIKFGELLTKEVLATAGDAAKKANIGISNGE